MIPDVAPVVDLLLARPATLGPGRLLCVDGPAGSGKTTLADRAVGELTARGLAVELVHMDDVYAGWDGLSAAGDQVGRQVVAPLAGAEAGSYRRYDWDRGEYAEVVTVPLSDVLVIEGVGSGSPRYADRTTLLVFVEAPLETRLRRGLERDGEAMQPHWRRWAVEEQALHRAERTRARADVVVDGVSGRSAVRRKQPAPPVRPVGQPRG